MKPRILAGPMVWVTFVVAVLWLALGVVGLLLFPDFRGVLFAVGGMVGGALTGWLAASMLVRYGPFGIKLPGFGEVPWEDIVSVEVLSAGILSVPAVGVGQGRALEEVQLGGLAWFGQGSSAKFAQRLADAAGHDDVVIRGKPAPGRRMAE